jgi:hypothetical protein
VRCFLPAASSLAVAGGPSQGFAENAAQMQQLQQLGAFPSEGPPRPNMPVN